MMLDDSKLWEIWNDKFSDDISLLDFMAVAEAIQDVSGAIALIEKLKELPKYQQNHHGDLVPTRGAKIEWIKLDDLEKIISEAE